MRLTTDGLIVREQFTGESTRIITVLTREHGLLRAFSPGARSLKSKYVSSTQLLCFSKLSLVESKGIYRVESASPIDVFFELRIDVIKLSLAQYFCELAMFFTPEGDDCTELLRLLLNAMKFLEKEMHSPAKLKATVELRILSLTGYLPDLVGCRDCANFSQDTYYFDPIAGTVQCEACAQLSGTAGIRISYAVFCAMRHIIYSEFQKIFSFKLSPAAELELEQVSEEYLLAHAERNFTTLQFYHSL